MKSVTQKYRTAMLIELKEKPGQISEPGAAAEIFKSILAFESEVDQDKEHFWAMGLNAKNLILYIELVALGTLTNTLVHPREVFRMAILKAAANIIVGHNHPSGDPEPSRLDKELGLRLKQAGEILNIEVLDQIIIGNNNPGYACMKSGVWCVKGKVHPDNFGRI